MNEKKPHPIWDPLDLSDIVESFMITEKKPKVPEEDDQMLLFENTEECVTETGDN